MSTIKIKMLWDFRGAHSQKIAQHHQIHLQEFAAKENLEFQETGIHVVSPMHSIAYLMTSESEMLMVRDALKPHRGEKITLE